MAVLAPLAAQAQFVLQSPDKNITVDVNGGRELTYNVKLNGKTVIADSPLAMTFASGKVWGENCNAKSAKVSRRSVKGEVKSPFYRSESMTENYNQMILDFRGGWSIEFRAYNDGVAYRFIGQKRGPVEVANETVAYNFPADAKTYAAYVKPRKDDPYFNSFENEYAVANLSKLDSTKMILLPVTVDLDNGVKVTITESDLESYPGLYMNPTGTAALRGSHARYPKTLKQGGHNQLQMLITERENYIAKSAGDRSYPWRVAVITDNDAKLAATDLSYLLASPSRVADTQWVKPGKVAWDWWNAWNLTGVDFKAGVNNDTYKAYIDFASRNGIEYVILDEGWAVNKKADLMQVVPEINLEELISYAKDRGVGIVLWAGYHAFDRDLENVCRHYSQMGVKGFKVDFMDRDDQQMVDFIHRASKMAEKYHLFLDFHGMYKPAGLNRTYPHVLNFEGVNGMEQMKWSDITLDQVEYDVTIPFIRQIAGPMDYTPGAMRNGTKRTYHKDYYEPMSQGTRCRQLAMFVVFDAPFAMLSDTPVNYDREPESRDFIAGVPTVWDETRILDGQLGDYIITARRKGDTWYVGGMTDWTPRDIKLDLSQLGLGSTPRKAVLFRDGVNAAHNANDYKREELQLDPTQPLQLHLAPGGGFVIKL